MSEKNKKSIPSGILGTKIGMTQIFNKKGLAIPVTLIKVGPCIVTQIKIELKDGYNAIQLGYFSPENIQNCKKPELGHFLKNNIPFFKYLREYLVENPTDFFVGQQIDISSLNSVRFLDVQGNSIGKGFCGTIKRYHFGRGPMTHGSKNHRPPGSIGAGSTPGRVFPGKKMPGHKGNKKTTIKKLKIIRINQDDNILILRGSVPGKPGNLLSIKPSHNKKS